MKLFHHHQPSIAIGPGMVAIIVGTATVTSGFPVSMSSLLIHTPAGSTVIGTAEVKAMSGPKVIGANTQR
jgi:hypothetical protein